MRPLDAVQLLDSEQPVQPRVRLEPGPSRLGGLRPAAQRTGRSRRRGRRRSTVPTSSRTLVSTQRGSSSGSTRPRGCASSLDVRSFPVLELAGGGYVTTEGSSAVAPRTIKLATSDKRDRTMTIDGFPRSAGGRAIDLAPACPIGRLVDQPGRRCALARSGAGSHLLRSRACTGREARCSFVISGRRPVPCSGRRQRETATDAPRSRDGCSSASRSSSPMECRPRNSAIARATRSGCWIGSR